MAIDRYNGRGRIGPSFRGQFYEYERNGQRVISSWPPKRGKPISEKQALTQSAFKQVCEAIKRTAGPIQNLHRLAAVGTPMLPRDTLFAAYYGNGPTIKFYDGRVVKPMANKYLASTVLDAIGWSKGDILYRGPDQWEVLPAGAVGQILALSDDLIPQWQNPPEAGGSGGTWLTAAYNSDSTGAGATRAFPISPIIDAVIDAVWFYQSGLAGYVYRVGIYQVNASRMITKVVRVETVPCIVDGTRRKVVYKLANSAPLEGGKTYAVALTAYHGDDTTPTRCSISSAYPGQYPANEILQGWNLPKRVPALGDAFTVSGTTTFMIYPRIG